VPNIEIKAAYDDFDFAHSVLARLDAKPVGTDHQIDTYFTTPHGRLKLRESSLSGAQLIPYLRPDQTGPKRSDYLVLPVEDPEECKRLFSELLGVDCIVDKVREIFLIGNVRVHLDRVKHLGTFLEFEAVYDNSLLERAEHEKVQRLMTEFRIPREDLLKNSYRELVAVP